MTTGDALPDYSINGNRRRNNLNNGYSIEHSQESIYDYFLDIVKTCSADFVLQEFARLFIQSAGSERSDVSQALHELTFANNEETFRNTLKRTCYILVNNWDTSRNYRAIQDLIKLFSDPTLQKYTASTALRRVRTWVSKFVQSQDFKELELFAARHVPDRYSHWKHRYSSFLLATQYTNPQNSLEQRRAARMLSRKLREQFKFKLAMYVAHSQTTSLGATSKEDLNPTALGEEALLLIKALAVRRGSYSYTNLARLFLSQTKHLAYGDFKRSLQNYLTFSVGDVNIATTLSQRLADQFENLYVDMDEEPVTSPLLLKTCKRIIELLTTENHQDPSPLFVSLVSSSSPLVWALMLLKIILICPQIRPYLEACVARIIQYYEPVPADDCQWVIHFIEVLNIVLAIHADNVEYNLIKVQDDMDESSPELESVSDYRVFSQIKY